VFDLYDDENILQVDFDDFDDEVEFMHGIQLEDEVDDIMVDLVQGMVGTEIIYTLHEEEVLHLQLVLM
jgi:hypothetical protein